MPTVYWRRLHSLSLQSHRVADRNTLRSYRLQAAPLPLCSRPDPVRVPLVATDVVPTAVNRLPCSSSVGVGGHFDLGQRDLHSTSVMRRTRRTRRKRQSGKDELGQQTTTKGHHQVANRSCGDQQGQQQATIWSRDRLHSVQGARYQLLTKLVGRPRSRAMSRASRSK